MLFNSLHYLLFLPLTVTLFFLLPPRTRTAFLVVASCYFYMVFKPIYILILFAVITIDYCSGLYIERSVGPRRRLGLIASIASNLGILFVFKYYAFVIGNLMDLSHTLGTGLLPLPASLHLLLPIGLSFHTFQSLAYVIEVFYGRFAAEHNPVRFALYVLFFPQMIAGPIERPQGLLRQFTRLDRQFSYADTVDGLRLILVGFWCKVLIADNLAPYVDAAYSNPSEASGFIAVIATLCFALQIYSDFYGYSLIAIGSARILGISLAANFDHPYRAASVSDFWRRWHISLSTWFRDYVYVPLGGNRVSHWRRNVNILVVFLLSGLWHGASWTYVVWGGLHGLYLLIEKGLTRVTGPYEAIVHPHRPRVVARVLVLTGICVAWVFFRANSLTDAATLLWAMATRWSTLGTDVRATFERLPEYGTVVNSATVGLVAFAFLSLGLEPMRARGWGLPRAVRWTTYYVMIAAILIFAKTEARSFIYFQF